MSKYEPLTAKGPKCRRCSSECRVSPQKNKGKRFWVCRVNPEGHGRIPLTLGVALQKDAKDREYKRQIANIERMSDDPVMASILTQKLQEKISNA